MRKNKDIEVLKGNLFDVGLFEQWLRDKKDLADSSIYVYTRAVERFLATDPVLDKVDDYNAFLIKSTIKKRCTHYYSIIKSFIQFKVPDANTRNRIMENLVKPKERRDIVRDRKYLKEDKIYNVVNNLKNDKHKVIAVIQALTGVRSGDILRMREGSILEEELNGYPALRLNILGKGRKRNIVYLFDEVAIAMVQEYIDEVPTLNGYYFMKLGYMKNREGNSDNIVSLMKMNYQWYWHDLKQALQKSGIDKDDFSTHDFRRCFARRVWEKTKDVHILQKALNHSDPKVTMRYLEQSGLQVADIHFKMQN